MNTACHSFRRLLERRLMGLPDAPRVSELDWHEHVHGCEACRELLHTEEALEELLASLPELRLPKDLAQRVLARLRAAENTSAGDSARDARLDELLAFDSDEEGAAPRGLAARVLANLAPERVSPDLDALLDRAGRVSVPADLSKRVLTGLAEHRTPLRAAPAGGIRLRILGAPILSLAAAALVASLALAAFWRLRAEHPGDGGAPGTDSTPVATGTGADPDMELLAALPVLEHWDLLADVGDPNLAAFNRFDAGDEALLEWFGAELLGEESTSDGGGGR
jgi:hypothetical protein